MENFFSIFKLHHYSMYCRYTDRSDILIYLYIDCIKLTILKLFWHRCIEVSVIRASSMHLTYHILDCDYQLRYHRLHELFVVLYHFIQNKVWIVMFLLQYCYFSQNYYRQADFNKGKIHYLWLSGLQRHVLWQVFIIPMPITSLLCICLSNSATPSNVFRKFPLFYNNEIWIKRLFQSSEKNC